MRMRVVSIVTLVALLTMLFPGSVVNAQAVTFPDPNLEAAIREAIGKPTGDILQSDLAGLTSFYAPERAIADITGIEHCTSLTSLGLWGNEIGDISPLSTLTSLTFIAIGGNPISDITPLASLSNLTDLYLDVSWTTDFTPLASLTNLTTLELAFNTISDISPLLSLTSLTGLGLMGNLMTDLSQFSSLTGLDSLEIVGNPLNAAAYDIYIPQLQSGGVDVTYSGPNTPVGSNVVVDLWDDGTLLLTFSDVLAKGHTVWGAPPAPPLGVPPPGYTLVDGGVLGFATGAVHSGTVAWEISYDFLEPGLTNEDSLRMFLWKGSQWEDVTASLDTANNILYAQTSTLGLGPISLAQASGTNTPPGSDIPVDLGDVQVTFENVSGEGTTTVTTQQGNPGGPIPPNFRVRGQFVDIVTTATYTGNVTVGIRYAPGTENPQNLKMFHDEGGNWVDVTTWVDTANRIVYGEVSSFSWFFIGGEWVYVAESAPVAPNVYIGVAAAFSAAILAFGIRRRLVRLA